MEYLDYYDENQRHLGRASREEVHQKGWWHKTFHAWIVREEEKKGYLLFQLRKEDKDVQPSTYDISAAGHLAAGEDLRAGSREIQEELGISYAWEDLWFLGVRTEVARIGKLVNCEFCYTYLLAHHAPLSSYQLQASELSGLIQVDISQGLALCGGYLEQVRVEGIFFQKDGTIQAEQRVLRREDLLPRPMSYYITIFIMAERLLENKPYLGIS